VTVNLFGALAHGAVVISRQFIAVWCTSATSSTRSASTGSSHSRYSLRRAGDYVV